MIGNTQYVLAYSADEYDDIHIIGVTSNEEAAIEWSEKGLYYFYYTTFRMGLQEVLNYEEIT